MLEPNQVSRNYFNQISFYQSIKISEILRNPNSKDAYEYLPKCYISVKKYKLFKKHQCILPSQVLIISDLFGINTAVVLISDYHLY